MKRVLSGLLRASRKAGPYLLVELLLPGGTLIALLLWFSSNGIGRFTETHQRLLSPSAIEHPLVTRNPAPSSGVALVAAGTS